MSSKTKLIGCSGEFAVVKKLLELGCEVYRDVTDSCDADLVIKHNGVLRTIQVKTLATTKNGSIAIRLWKQQRGKGSVAYTGSEFDILAFHVLDRNVTLFFRLSELILTGNKSIVTIRIDDVSRSDQRIYTDYLSLDRCMRP